MLKLKYLSLAAFLICSSIITAQPTGNFYQLAKVYRGTTPIPGGIDHRLVNDNSKFGSSATLEGVQWYILGPSNGNGGIGAGYSMLIENEVPLPLGYIDHYTTCNTTFGNNPYFLGYSLSPSASINGKPVRGLQILDRYLRNWTTSGNNFFDHLIANPTETATSLNSKGYYKEGTNGYGFPRYGWDVEKLVTPGDYSNWYRNDVQPDTKLDFNGVKIGFCKAWGGAISSIYWGGKEFINNNGAGTLLQMSCTWQELGEQFNPTEAGDDPGNGSPVISLAASGSTCTAECMPLLWIDPRITHSGTSRKTSTRQNPLLYGGTISSVTTIQANVANAKRITISKTFTPYETSQSNWHLDASFYLTDVTLNKKLPTRGSHVVYISRDKNPLAFTGQTDITSANEGWLNKEARQIGTESIDPIPTGTNVLYIAKSNLPNTKDTTFGVFVKNIPSNLYTIVMAETVPKEQGKSYHDICFDYPNVGISPGTSQTRSFEILIGKSSADVIAAANALIKQ